MPGLAFYPFGLLGWVENSKNEKLIHPQLKSDRPHPRDYPHSPTDYRHVYRLVIGVCGLCCIRQSPDPNIDDCTPEILPWPWPMTLTPTKIRFLAFDFDLWPTFFIRFLFNYNQMFLFTGDLTRHTLMISTRPHIPLTYDLDLQSQPLLGQGQPPCQKSRSNVKRFSWEIAHTLTNKRTDGRYQVHYTPASLKLRSW